MNIVFGSLVVAAAAAAAISAMLLVRRRAPEGSYFADGDRASGVFGMLATGFSVLLGFIIFLAFTSYDQSRTGAEAEALAVTQQMETAQLFPGVVAQELTGELVCYGRTVVGQEWKRMAAGTQGDINPWGVQLFRTIRTVEPRTARQQSAYDKWLELTSTREEARRDRIHGAAGVIPAPLWVVLGVMFAIVIAFMLFFADRGERAVTQAMLIGSVTSVITIMLVLLVFLDSPFRAGVGALRPVAMQRSLQTMEQALAATGTGLRAPCDAEGRRL